MRTITTPGEPVDINSIKSEGSVTVVGRLLASRKDVIHRKDGSGSIDVVRGRVADDSGAIGFLSWEPFEHEIGSLLKIENAQIRVFRDTLKSILEVLPKLRYSMIQISRLPKI